MDLSNTSLVVAKQQLNSIEAEVPYDTGLLINHETAYKYWVRQLFHSKSTLICKRINYLIDYEISKKTIDPRRPHPSECLR